MEHNGRTLLEHPVADRGSVLCCRFRRHPGKEATTVQDQWAAGSTYEAFMGRWSRDLAPRFISWLDIPRSVSWLDVGCGTGSLSRAICALADPTSVVGCDPAAPLVDFAREHFRDTRVSFVTAGIGELPHRPGGYGSVTSLLALNFFPDSESAVREMQSVASPGGTVSACVWDYEGGMEFLRRFWDAAVRVDPTARELDEGVRFPLCRPDALTALVRGAGLAGVRCDSIEVPTVFAGFDDYWRPFLGGTGPAPSYVGSLDEERRQRLARMLDEALPRSPEGTIALTARAWAVRGIVIRSVDSPN